MSKPIIPIRPKNKRYGMTPEEMDCLVWHVISGCKREDAYMMFVRPDLRNSPKLKKEYANQFFSSADARNFVSDYKKTLECAEDSSGPEITDEDREKRKRMAQKNVEDKTIDIMLGELETVEKLDAVVRVADRIGTLAEKTAVSEAPRRYLPVRCSECAYKSFVDKYVESGDIVNDCMYCRALKIAEDHGFMYDPKNMLDIPENNAE